MVSSAFIVGIIGNVISVLLCASPMGTFVELAKKKSGENYNALPYISALLCKSLWTFYGTLDKDGLLIVTVNSVGVFSQLIYVTIYLFYAPIDKKVSGRRMPHILFYFIFGIVMELRAVFLFSSMVKAIILVGILNIGIPSGVISATLLGFNVDSRQTFLGLLCAIVTIAMYAAPLSVMYTVIKTKSVEYMPFFLSFFLLLNASCWFAFGFLQNDHYVIMSNAIGILSSSTQLVIYMIYKDKCSSSSSLRNEPQQVVEEKFGEFLASIEEGIVESKDLGQVITKEEKPCRFMNRSASLPKPSLSRENSIQKVMKAFSFSKCHSDLMYMLVP